MFFQLVLSYLVVGQDVQKVSEADLHQALLSHDRVLVKFVVTWCSYCQQFEPKFNRANRQLRDAGSQTLLISVDMDENPNVRNTYPIPQYPTVLYFVNGVYTVFTGRDQAAIVSYVQEKERSQWQPGQEARDEQADIIPQAPVSSVIQEPAIQEPVIQEPVIEEPAIQGPEESSEESEEEEANDAPVPGQNTTNSSDDPPKKGPNRWKVIAIVTLITLLCTACMGVAFCAYMVLNPPKKSPPPRKMPYRPGIKAIPKNLPGENRRKEVPKMMRDGNGILAQCQSPAARSIRVTRPDQTPHRAVRRPERRQRSEQPHLRMNDSIARLFLEQ